MTEESEAEERVGSWPPGDTFTASPPFEHQCMWGKGRGELQEHTVGRLSLSPSAHPTQGAQPGTPVPNMAGTVSEQKPGPRCSCPVASQDEGPTPSPRSGRTGCSGSWNPWPLHSSRGARIRASSSGPFPPHPRHPVPCTEVDPLGLLMLDHPESTGAGEPVGQRV